MRVGIIFISLSGINWSIKINAGAIKPNGGGTMDKRTTASDVFFNLYQDGTLSEAQEFLSLYPYFRDVFTPEELVQDFQDRV